MQYISNPSNLSRFRIGYTRSDGTRSERSFEKDAAGQLVETTNAPILQPTEPDGTAASPEPPKPLLKFASDYDETTRVHMFLAQKLAQNADGSIYLQRSNGHRRAGCPSFYWLRRPEQMAKRITAWTDEDALDSANRALEAN